MTETHFKFNTEARQTRALITACTAALSKIPLWVAFINLYYTAPFDSTPATFIILDIILTLVLFTNLNQTTSNKRYISTHLITATIATLLMFFVFSVIYTDKTKTPITTLYNMTLQTTFNINNHPDTLKVLEKIDYPHSHYSDILIQDTTQMDTIIRLTVDKTSTIKAIMVTMTKKTPQKSTVELEKLSKRRQTEVNRQTLLRNMINKKYGYKETYISNANKYDGQNVLTLEKDVDIVTIKIKPLGFPEPNLESTRIQSIVH